MLVRIASLTERPLSFFRSISYRRIDSTPNSASREMNFDDLDSDGTKCVNLRLCNVSGCMTEILEIHADQPSLHVVFVPGNPGRALNWFIYSARNAKETAEEGSILHWTLPVFSLKSAIKETGCHCEGPEYCPLLCLLSLTTVSYHTQCAIYGQDRVHKETPDWNFMRENQEKISFLYGIDDHWGPLQMFEEVSRQASGIALSIEREGHTHGFCCSEAGSIWVARHAASLIKNKLAN
ncbi:hypothetical protein V6N12_024667 [Hibiscus sabdariffa]|uniref:Uncharacterized protein n=1 Tax=Hibiscus sabdariffa TaxID=183260 RepID=A0ABR2G168_9ROSI